MIIHIVRPDDLLNLHIETVNLKLNKENPQCPVLISAEAGAPSYLIVHFTPQNIVEQAFPDPGSTSQAGTVKALFGGPTRLVFLVPNKIQIPFTLAGLLDWSKFELHVSSIADVPANTQPSDPSSLTISQPKTDETIIEIPYRLQISPTHTAVWDHALKPFSDKGRTEIWHTRLAALNTNGAIQPADNDHPISLRAIWSPDYTPDNPPNRNPPDLHPPFISSLSTNETAAFNRYQIVILTSAFSGHTNSDGSPYSPQPILGSQLILSSLGGWLSSVGSWNPPQGLDISQWTHIASQGRDQYVRIVQEGRMKWTGHHADLITVTERRFEPDPTSGGPVAYLRQYQYIIIREPEIDYTNPEDPTQGRGMPLKKIRLTTLVTPPIEQGVIDTTSSFWVMLNNNDFPFHAIADDSAGNKIDFVTSLIFVPDSETNAGLKLVENNFANAGSRRDVQVPGQKVCLVPPGSISNQEGDDAGNHDNSSPITNALNFVNESTLKTPSDINKVDFFTPSLFRADVRIPQIQEITGIDNPTSISFHKDYVTSGFDSINTTKVFSQIVDPTQLPYDPTQGFPLGTQGLKNAPLDLGFTAQQVGGLTTPNLSITSISASMGPLGGPPSVNGLPDPQAIADNIKDIMKNKFDPTKIFDDINATLFGSFKLSDLLPLPDDGAVDKDSPKMTVTRNGTTITIHLDWQPRIRGIPGDVIIFTPTSSSKLIIQGELKKDLTALQQQAEFSISCKLNDFSIELLKVITINFVLFSFIAQSGKKVNVSVKLNDTTPVEFDGELNFVNSLRNLIPSGAFGSSDGDGDGDGGSGVSIDLIKNPLGIKACYAVTIPPASVGIFSLRNIALSACLTLPFEDGKPVFDFSFARRDNHFLLAISFLGGGGFFHIGLDTSGIQILEAALEFGAAAAIDLGVASGEVHLMAGIYFSMSGTESQLTGYVRCGGSLCVLGLISVSVEFNLSLKYSGGRASGRATLTITIHVAFFQKSVDLTVERSFGDGAAAAPAPVPLAADSVCPSNGKTPTFADLIYSPSVWYDYAEAFA